MVRQENRPPESGKSTLMAKAVTRPNPAARIVSRSPRRWGTALEAGQVRPKVRSPAINMPTESHWYTVSCAEILVCGSPRYASSMNLARADRIR